MYEIKIFLSLIITVTIINYTDCYYLYKDQNCAVNDNKIMKECMY